MSVDRLMKAISISRPIFWPAPMAAYAAGLLAGGVQHSPFVIWEFLLAAFPLSFAVYFLNDYFDMPYDKANPRKGGIWGYRLTKEDASWAWKLCAFFAILAILTAIISFNPVHAILIAAGMLLPYIYSVPPFRLKNVPIADSLVCAGYAFVPFAAAAALGHSSIPFDPRFLLVTLMAAALHALAAVMDYDKDKKAGQNTFAVAFGPRAPALFAAAIFFLNLVFVFPYLSPLSLGILIAALLSLALAIKPSPKNALSIFKVLAAYGFIACYFLLAKYILFASQLADYSETEFSILLKDCASSEPLSPPALCGSIDRLKAECEEGHERFPNSCAFLEAQLSLVTE